MASNPYLRQAAKYAVITAIVFGLGIVVFGSVQSGNLAGRLVTSTDPNDVQTLRLSVDRIVGGTTAPKDTNVIFTIPPETTISLLTFLGGSEYTTKRYWGYCFSGREQENKVAGLTGRELYDGKYFYSDGEVAADLNRRAVGRSGTRQDLVALRRMKGSGSDLEGKASEITVLEGGQTCYVMSEVPLPIGLDQDGDGLNDEQERIAKTDPLLADTDGDELSDTREVESKRTSPLIADTDRDGLLDGLEDRNHNGVLDPGETSPVSSDTDRDELCDGDGHASGCPEPRKTVCNVRSERFGILYGGDDKERVTSTTDCIERVTSPVQGEDINQNGVRDGDETDPTKAETNPGRTDWQWKYDQIVNRLRDQRGTFVGTGTGRMLLPFQLLSPNGATTARRGSLLDIRWSTGREIESPVTISLASTDRQQILVTVTHSTPNDGAEQWYVDAPVGNYVLLVELCKNCSTGYSFDYANAPIVITNTP